ncbi:MAG: ABC transporter permease subunit, partial [Pseudolabrys sp.]
MSRAKIVTQWRAPAILVIVTLGFAIADGSNGRFLSLATAFSTFETFATIGVVALGLGITMIMREFDLSVAGMFSMAGCIAVLTGAEQPVLGVLAAVVVGVLGGAGQGFLIEKLRLASIGVTLGGLLISIGASHVLTQGVTLTYSNLGVAAAMGHSYLGVFSIRSIFALLLFALAAIVISCTRVGR